MSAPVTTTTAQIRARFPALQRQHDGHPVAYFDGPGGTQVPQSVVDAMSDYLLHHNANTHWAYPTSNETDAMLLAARTCGRRLPQCHPARDRLREQHDDGRLPSGARPRAPLGPRR